MIVAKVSLNGIKGTDFNVIATALDSYKTAITYMLESQNRSQQYIHYSILDQFCYEMLKKINSRTKPKFTTIRMELATAFIAFDALQYYSNQCDNHLESAVLNRLMIALHAELPRTSDGKYLTILSDLNFAE